MAMPNQDIFASLSQIYTLGTIPTSSPSNPHELAEGDRFLFVDTKSSIARTIKYDVAAQYCNSQYNTVNSGIFDVLGIDAIAFCTEKYGYEPTGGSWPSFRPGDFAALTRCVIALAQEAAKQGWKFECSKSLQIPEPKKPARKSFADLKKLVLDEGVKEEITSILRQHEYAVTLFDKWGLGDIFEYGRGMTMLFHGPPGTGKTWAANCISKALGQKLLIVGAAEIQTSEPGGANRNIQNAFSSAKSEKKVLFFDECDSLITNRNHVGMILGSEINTLLTEIERFEGVCILATNRIDTLDEALERRLALIVNFPKPTASQREEIWRVLLPKKLPLGVGVTIEKLAEYNLTGGQIKNVILNAARMAISKKQKRVTIENFEAAVQRTLGNIGLMGKENGFFRALGATKADAKVRDVSTEIVRL